MKRILKIIGKVIIAIVILAIVAYSAAILIMGRKVESKINALKAAGKPVSVADLKPNIPDSENAAVIYAQAFKLMSKPDVGKDMKTVAIFVSHPKPVQAKNAEEAIARSEKIMKLAEQAVSRPHCRFPIQPGDPSQQSQSLHHFAYLGALGRLYSADAVLKTNRGDMDGAIRSLETGIKVADSMKEEPGIFSMLCRHAVIAIVTNGVRKTAEHGTLNQEQAKQLQSMLSGIDFKQSYAAAMDGERAMFISSLLIQTKHLPRGLMLYPNQLGVIDGIDRLLKASNYPYRIIKQNKMLPDRQGRLCVIANMLVPVYNRTLESRDRAIANVGSAQVFVALAAYRSKFGHYPASLKELKSKTGLDLPQDPFSGKDFVYKPTTTGFVLYSYGEDLKDNGGQEYISGKRKPNQDYDIVWKAG